MLEDVPKGAFLCTYNGLVCSDGTGNARGIAFGDEYLMELDYIGGYVYVHYVGMYIRWVCILGGCVYVH